MPKIPDHEAHQIDADEARRAVGVDRRHSKLHIARVDNDERKWWILHSQDCADQYYDLRNCEFSKAMQNATRKELKRMPFRSFYLGIVRQYPLSNFIPFALSDEDPTKDGLVKDQDIEYYKEKSEKLEHTVAELEEKLKQTRTSRQRDPISDEEREMVKGLREFYEKKFGKKYERP